MLINARLATSSSLWGATTVTCRRTPSPFGNVILMCILSRRDANSESHELVQNPGRIPSMIKKAEEWTRRKEKKKHPSRPPRESLSLRDAAPQRIERHTRDSERCEQHPRGLCSYPHSPLHRQHHNGKPVWTMFTWPCMVALLPPLISPLTWAHIQGGQQCGSPLTVDHS
jgi:hypothetical protein